MNPFLSFILQATQVTVTVPGFTLSLLYALLPTLAYAIGSYLQNTPQEKFDVAGFLKTIALSLAIGYYQYTLGITADQAGALVTQNFVIMFFINKVIDGVVDWVRVHKGVNLTITIGKNPPPPQAVLIVGATQPTPAAPTS